MRDRLIPFLFAIVFALLITVSFRRSVSFVVIRESPGISLWFIRRFQPVIEIKIFNLRDRNKLHIRMERVDEHIEFIRNNG